MVNIMSFIQAKKAQFQAHKEKSAQIARNGLQVRAQIAERELADLREEKGYLQKKEDVAKLRAEVGQMKRPAILNKLKSGGSEMLDKLESKNRQPRIMGASEKNDDNPWRAAGKEKRNIWRE